MRLDFLVEKPSKSYDVKLRFLIRKALSGRRLEFFE